MEKKNETEYEKLARELSATVVDTANDILVEQFQLSKELRGMEVTTPEHLEQRTKVFVFRTSRSPPSKCSHRRPIHRRTRIVTAREIIDENGIKLLLITCGCGHFQRYLCACRHVYSLLDREPIGTEDVFPEKCKSYEVLYHKDEEFKKKCDKRTAELDKHQGLIIPLGELEHIKLNPW